MLLMEVGETLIRRSLLRPEEASSYGAWFLVETEDPPDGVEC